jgi:hypothetical protein
MNMVADHLRSFTRIICWLANVTSPKIVLPMGT